jgi:hypothetical protein
VRRDGDVIEACVSEDVSGPFRKLAVSRCSGEVWKSRQELVRVSDSLGIGCGQELALDLGLGPGAARREAEWHDGLAIPGGGKEREPGNSHAAP